jgi:hypothetical protein
MAPTALLKRFEDDLSNAKHPKAAPEECRPISLPLDEIDGLLSQIDLWREIAR